LARRRRFRLARRGGAREETAEVAQQFRAPSGSRPMASCFTSGDGRSVLPKPSPPAKVNESDVPAASSNS
jgi:hypothetical protein